MADRYQSLTATPVGKFLVKNLGLPDPTPLRRYTEGSPVLDGTFLVGGGGELVDAATDAITTAGGTAVRTAPDGDRLRGLVFDASDIAAVADLVMLRDFFSPVLRSLDTCPHVVVIGTTPEAATAPEARISPAGPGGVHPLPRQGGGSGRHGPARVRRACRPRPARIDPAVSAVAQVGVRLWTGGPRRY